MTGVAQVTAPVHATGQWRMVMAGDLTDKRVTPSRTVHVDAPKAEEVLQTAAKLAGTPYEYGGTTPSGFDCSGFTKYVFSKVGVDLPRTSSAQAEAVKTVSKAAKKPGDLLFFSDGGSVYHAAIYAGHNKMWTAPESGETVKLSNIFDSSYTVGRAW
jgi:cell wall-associated NlpC family hydrolase